jgi:hypothetical protein
VKDSKPVRFAVLLVLLAGFLVFATRSGALESVLEILTGHKLSAQGAPVMATPSRLSEHEIEYIQGLAPQQQAEQLITAAINHDDGATAMIMTRVDSWHGHIKRTKNWETLEQTALYSNDLRVRAAMIESDLASYDVDKSSEWADRLIQSGQETLGNRPYDAWVLGMLANRGVETERIHQLLRDWIHDSDEQTRFWAVEGLAHIGTDDTIPEFLDVLRNDPSQSVRERAGCSLAKSGMLTREQRMIAIPGLIEIAADPSVDSVTQGWAFQALREISDEPVGNDVAAWRNWYDRHGRERRDHFRKDSTGRVIGNT